jgi:hypothetical protein
MEKIIELVQEIRDGVSNKNGDYHSDYSPEIKKLDLLKKMLECERDLRKLETEK